MANQDPRVPQEGKQVGRPADVDGDVFAFVANAFYRVLAPVCRYLCYAAALMTLLMAIAMVVDLVSRLIFRSPLSGMIELQTFMLVFMAFFSVAYTMLKNQHVAVDRITSTLFCRVFSPFGGHSCLGR